MKVNAMEILYDSLFQRESIVDIVLNQYRYHLKSSEPSRPPSTFSRDQLEEVRLTINRSNNNWLQNTQFAY
jgi:hypothetical protein